uniref:Uncharacterized protein n=1 Tax=Anopheles dirus TaxID=7168 RepID=A0A182NWF2_9DIPT
MMQRPSRCSIDSFADFAVPVLDRCLFYPAAGGRCKLLTLLSRCSVDV